MSASTTARPGSASSVDSPWRLNFACPPTAPAATGEATVVEAVGQATPALVPLAGDIGLSGFALGVEAVELLLQPLVGGLPRVDGAAHRLQGHAGVLAHAASLLRRKKRKP